MKVNESYQSWASRPFTMARAAARPPYSDITNRSDMPKNEMEMYERNVGFPDSLLLTKDDIAMIKKVAGIDIDYDTGKMTGADEASPGAHTFMRSIIDKRYDAWSRQKPVDEVSPSSIRDIFQQSIRKDEPMDAAFMQKALDWLFERVGKDAEEKVLRNQVDLYA